MSNSPNCFGIRSSIHGAAALWIVLASTLMTSGAAASSSPVGFQYRPVPDRSDEPIYVGIWYPTDTPASSQSLGDLRQTVAANAPVTAEHLPLVVISHGSTGWFGDFVDTAEALASAGFVVVAPTHVGDNFRDQSQNGWRSMVDRPRQIRRVIDFMLSDWPQHTALDPEHIGFFGFSAGGFTGLVAIGGTPNAMLFRAHCAGMSHEPVCHDPVAHWFANTEAAALPGSTWVHEPRIKAAVLVSPGFAFAFSPNSLAQINVPVQLWGGSNDEFVPPESNTVYLAGYLQRVELHTVLGARHFTFLSPCSVRASTTCTDPPGIDRSQFHLEFNRDVIAFFAARLALR